MIKQLSFLLAVLSLVFSSPINQQQVNQICSQCPNGAACQQAQAQLATQQGQRLAKRQNAPICGPNGCVCPPGGCRLVKRQTQPICGPNGCVCPPGGCRLTRR